MMTLTLRRQFRLWTILLVAVPSLLIMVIYTAGQIRVAKQQSLEMIHQRVLFQERLIDYWMAERATDVRNLSQLDTFKTLSEHMQLTLQLEQAGDNNFDSLSYINKDGLFRLTTLSAGIKYPSAVGKPYFEAALAGKDYISDVVIGRNSGLPIINFSSPIYDYAGSFQGLVLGSVRTATLETLLHDNWIGQTGEVFLVNREGTMLTEPRHINKLIEAGLIKEPVKMKVKITDDALRNIQLGESGTAEWIDYLGNKVLGAYLDVPKRSWTIIGKINEREVLAPIYNQIAIMTGGTICLVLLILPLATLLTNRIKRPIDWLIGQTTLIADERYDIGDREDCSENMPHELITLCDTFVNMSQKIEKTVGLLKEKEAKLESKIVEIEDINAVLAGEIIERQEAEGALRKLNAELEQKVQERTFALSEMNYALERKIAEHQAVNKALEESRDALVISQEQLKHYAAELAATNERLMGLNEELKQTSLSDGLTGIANRRYFDECLQREWLRARREKKTVALVLLDIDFFKAYNDTYGHLAGDECLKMIANMLADMPKRAIDIVARYGGEEFAIVLPGADEKGAAMVGENVRLGVEKLGIRHEGSLINKYVTVSVGVAVITPDLNATSSSIITMADQALYQAKREGRNRIQIAKQFEDNA